jgi:lipoprotein-anchoring transpeptidase ErfK/SrfK
MKNGRLRIEDVQWVMYYNRKDGIAIHSAYWHDDFGKPVSHGCVNLTIPDARWLFEWSAPWVLPEDSERFPAPGQPGSTVVVFK